MSDGPSAEERKIAVLVAAMQDMHGEIEEMLKKMQAASRAANAASAEVRQAGAAVVPAVTYATAQAVEASMQRAFVDIAAPTREALEAAVKPVSEQFLGLAQRILQMEAIARRAMTWFSAKWIALTAAGFIGMSAMAWASVGWQRHIVNESRRRKRCSRRTLPTCRSMRRRSRRKARGSKSPTVVGASASSPARIRPGPLASGTGSGMTPRRGRRW
jgi:hypothetical protein